MSCRQASVVSRLIPVASAFVTGRLTCVGVPEPRRETGAAALPASIAKNLGGTGHCRMKAFPQCRARCRSSLRGGRPRRAPPEPWPRRDKLPAKAAPAVECGAQERKSSSIHAGVLQSQIPCHYRRSFAQPCFVLLRRLLDVHADHDLPPGATPLPCPSTSSLRVSALALAQLD